MTSLNNQPKTSLPEIGFIRLPMLMAISGLSKTTIYKHIANGQMPRGKKFGRATLWAVEDIKNWIAKVGAQACNDAIYNREA